MAKFHDETTIDIGTIDAALGAAMLRLTREQLAPESAGKLLDALLAHGLPRLLDGQAWVVGGTLYDPKVDRDEWTAPTLDTAVRTECEGCGHYIARHGSKGCEFENCECTQPLEWWANEPAVDVTVSVPDEPDAPEEGDGPNA